MKKLGFLFLLAASAFGQSTAGPFVISSGTSACAQIRVSGQSAVGITVVGTFSATLQPKVSIQGQTPTNIQVTPSSSSTAQSTITAVGNYTARVGGYDVFSVCVTAYTSGSATIYLNATQASASLGGTGGSSGGGGATSFDAITSGTNTTAAMVLGSGSSLATTGTGGIKLGNGDVNTPQAGFTSVSGAGLWYDPISGNVAWTDSAGFGASLWGFNPSTNSGGGASDFFLLQAGWFGFGTDTLGISAVPCSFCLIATPDGLASVTGSGVPGTPSTRATFASSVNTSALYKSSTDCAVNSVSPAACGSSASGAFVVPTTTSTYTVNTTAATTNAHIFLQARTYTGGLPGAPTCVAPAVTSAVSVSARTAATSFTFALPSTVGQTCWDYWIVSN